MVVTIGTFGPIRGERSSTNLAVVPLDRNGLEVLSRAECNELLAHATLGRVGVSMAALPVVLPVNYGVLDGDIVFSTIEGTKLAGAAANAVVAFEIDAIDGDGTGWSVLVIGMSSIVDDPVEKAAAKAVIPEQWLPVETTHVVRIRSDVVSGRRIVRVPAAQPIGW